MEFHRYESDRGFHTSVRVLEGLTGRAHWDVRLNAPVIGRVHVLFEGEPPAWLRDRISAEASFTFSPRHCGVWKPTVVVRAGFLDRDLGDVPILWQRRLYR